MNAAKGEDEDLVKPGNTFPTTTTHKTKAQIIARLQEAEADAWLELVQYDYGNAPLSCTIEERLQWERNDCERYALTSAWYVLRTLLESVDLRPATQLPQHRTAKEISETMRTRQSMTERKMGSTFKS